MIASFYFPRIDWFNFFPSICSKTQFSEIHVCVCLKARRVAVIPYFWAGFVLGICSFIVSRSCRYFCYNQIFVSSAAHGHSDCLHKMIECGEEGDLINVADKFGQSVLLCVLLNKDFTLFVLNQTSSFFITCGALQNTSNACRSRGSHWLRPLPIGKGGRSRCQG